MPAEPSDSAPLKLDHGEVTLQAEGDGARLFCQVDPRGNYVSHLLDTDDLDDLRRWLDARTHS